MRLFQKACELYDDYELDTALEHFQHLLAYHTDLISEWNLHEYMGMCYYYKGTYDNAVFHLEKAYSGAITDEDDNDGDLHLLIILTYLAEAYELISKGVEIDKKVAYPFRRTFNRNRSCGITAEERIR